MMKKLLFFLALAVSAIAQPNQPVFRRGANLPTTCNVGDAFYKTAATAGQYNCTAVNTWSGPIPTTTTAPGAPSGSVQVNCSGAFCGNALFKWDTSTVFYPAFNSGGLNDLTSGGTFTDGVANPGSDFYIEIDATGMPDTFKWQKNGGAFTNGVAITGAAQTLSNGVTITFAATTGHTLADNWDVTTSTSLVLDQTQVTANDGPVPFTIMGQTGGNTPQTMVLGMFNENVFVGQSAGAGSGGANGLLSNFGNNAFVGYEAGSTITTGFSDTSMGSQSGLLLTTGTNNTFLGYAAGSSIRTGSGNVMIGAQAGMSAANNASNKLYIANSNTATPLIGGDFMAGTLTFTANATISGTFNNYTFTTPATAATLTIANNGTLQTTGAFAINLTCAAACTPTFPNGNSTVARTDAANAFTGNQTLGTVVFASLGTPANGTVIYCSDCQNTTNLVAANTCANMGTGAFAARINGAWKCYQ